MTAEQCAALTQLARRRKLKEIRPVSGHPLMRSTYELRFRGSIWIMHPDARCEQIS